MINKHQIKNDFYKKKKNWLKNIKTNLNETPKEPKTNEILFDEELFPEAKENNAVRTYFGNDRELD